MVYVTAGATLYAFDALGVTNCTSGFCHPLWTATWGDLQLPVSPAVSEGVVYILEYGVFGYILYAFDAPRWHRPVLGNADNLQTAVVEHHANRHRELHLPSLDGGRVLVAPDDGNLYAFAASTGALDWSSPDGTSGTDIEFSSVPATSGGVVFAGSDDYHLHPFRASSGTPLWTSANLIDTKHSSPIVANGVLYIAVDGSVFAYDATGTMGCSGTPKTCQPLGQLGTSSPGFTSSPALVNGWLYASGNDGKLYAFHT